MGEEKQLPETCLPFYYDHHFIRNIMDPEIKKYFKKIISSFSAGFLWLFTVVTMGIYFQLGLVDGRLQWYNYAFYLCSILTLLWLLSFYFKLWKN